MVRMENNIGVRRTLPISMAWTNVPQDRNVPRTQLAFRDGSVPTGVRTVNERTFSVSGSIYFPTRAGVRAEYDSIMRFLRFQPIKVWQHTSQDRWMEAFVQGVPQVWLQGRRELQVSIEFVAMEPFFRGEDLQNVQNISTAIRNYSITLGGSADMRPVFEVEVLTGSVNNFGVENQTTEQTIEVNNVLQSGDVATIDTRRFTVAINGENILDAVGELWFLTDFWLQYGANQLVFTASGTYNVELRTLYFHKWF